MGRESINSLRKVLQGTVDPTVTPVPGLIGDLYMRTATGSVALYQKQVSGNNTSWALVGGGGSGGIQVLTADPIAPAEDEQWFLVSDAVPPSAITLQIVDMGSGMLAIQQSAALAVPTFNDSTFAYNQTGTKFIDSVPPTPPGALPDAQWIFTDDMPPMISFDPAGTATQPQYELHYDSTINTYQDVVDIINMASQAAIGKDYVELTGLVPGGSLFDPSDAFVFVSSIDIVNPTCQLKLFKFGIKMSIPFTSFV